MPLLLCPNCNTSMQAIQRLNVELDMCPQCRGVWLDRGELEKVLDHERGRPTQDHGGPESHERRGHDRSPWDRDDHHQDSHGRHKKRPSIFDIFD